MSWAQHRGSGVFGAVSQIARILRLERARQNVRLDVCVCCLVENERKEVVRQEKDFPKEWKRKTLARPSSLSAVLGLQLICHWSVGPLQCSVMVLYREGTIPNTHGLLVSSIAQRQPNTVFDTIETKRSFAA